MFQFSWLHNNPPVPNLASSNNKLFLCHGPVGWESRCGLAGSLTLGSFTGCPEGVGSGCSCLVAGLGQNSFPASLRGLLLRLVPHKLSDRWPLFFAGCWTEAPLAPWHMGSYIMVAGFLPSEGERDLVWPRSIRGLWGSSLWLPEAQSFLFHHGVELHSRNRSQFVLQLIVFFFSIYVYSVVSDPLGPHGLYPTGLLCPWNSPGQDTGVGLLFPSPGDLPNPWIEPGSPTLQADSLLSETPGKPLIDIWIVLNLGLLFVTFSWMFLFSLLWNICSHFCW